MLLDRKNIQGAITQILYDVFVYNCNEYPIKFDDFGKQITDRLMDKFDEIERDPQIFDRMNDLPFLPLEINKRIKFKKG